MVVVLDSWEKRIGRGRQRILGAAKEERNVPRIVPKEAFWVTTKANCFQKRDGGSILKSGLYRDYWQGVVAVVANVKKSDPKV